MMNSLKSFIPRLLITFLAFILLSALEATIFSFFTPMKSSLGLLCIFSSFFIFFKKEVYSGLIIFLLCVSYSLFFQIDFYLHTSIFLSAFLLSFVIGDFVSLSVPLMRKAALSTIVLYSYLLEFIVYWFQEPERALNLKSLLISFFTANLFIFLTSELILGYLFRVWGETNEA